MLIVPNYPMCGTRAVQSEGFKRTSVPLFRILTNMGPPLLSRNEFVKQMHGRR